MYIFIFYGNNDIKLPMKKLVARSKHSPKNNNFPTFLREK
ncbi:hypothetical protein HMPREF0650_1851 [Hoylesella buccalis ATCC 35310]|uniref:Uncharacterized protein n=1 Tax=Hoylesella buccalis ATCC 35310 TaxID=679190 RepID=D1W6K9_9BACT|nr:hypothetical protein HMPREF0650_1851 [Hoylesella buccalis ATCC 35310]